MNPQTVVALIEVAERLTQLAIEERAKSGIQDDQLLEAAGTQNEETRAKVQRFLDKLAAS